MSKIRVAIKSTVSHDDFKWVITHGVAEVERLVVGLSNKFDVISEGCWRASKVFYDDNTGTTIGVVSPVNNKVRPFVSRTLGASSINEFTICNGDNVEMFKNLVEHCLPLGGVFMEVENA